MLFSRNADPLQKGEQRRQLAQSPMSEGLVTALADVLAGEAERKAKEKGADRQQANQRPKSAPQ